MTDEATTDELTELAEQFGLDTDIYDVADIHPALVRVMQYIKNNTGLLEDYNTGIVHLGEGGRIIQWHGRTRTLSGHDDLLRWVQMEAPGVLIAIMGVRQHPDRKEPAPYAEIHLAKNWGYDYE